MRDSVSFHSWASQWKLGKTKWWLTVISTAAPLSPKVEDFHARPC
jgi:hypothetical protein